MKPRIFLPLLTYPDPVPDWSGRAACRVASLLDGSLHAKAFNVAIPDVSNWFSKLVVDLPEMIRSTEQRSREAGEQLISSVQLAAATEGISVTTEATRAAMVLLGSVAAEDARYFDLAVVGMERGNETTRASAEAIIFGSGRPTLLLPTATPSWEEHVAVAWDGSRAAARALGDAMPFLAQASEVTVFTVVNDKPMNDRDIAERLAEELRQRGLSARSVSLVGGDLPVGITLQDQALAAGAGLLVMGGHGHSAVREFVLGSATEDILDDLKMPILCSH